METKQELWEAEMLRLGREREEKRMRANQARGREETNPAGARLMREAAGHVVAAIEQWMKTSDSRPGRRHRALRLLRPIKKELLASLALECVIGSLSRERAYTATCQALGTRIEDEANMQAFKATSPGGLHRAVERVSDYTGYQRKRRHIMKAMTLFGINRVAWSDEERVSVGTVLLELVIESTGLVKVYRVRTGRKETLKLGPTEETLQWVESIHADVLDRQALQLPALEEPLDWVSPISGGYHTTNLRTSAVVKTRDKAHYRSLWSADLSEVYKATNALQRSKWRVNRYVFEVYSHLWQNGYDMAGMPPRTAVEVPPKPADISSNEESRKQWRIQAREAHDTNNRRWVERMQSARIHWVAEALQDQEFYFCHQLDWRGRAYPVGYYLQPQGSDVVKALLEFAEAKPVNTDHALMWHRIHGANCWGLDKLPFEERIRWVLENEEMLLRIGEDPLASKEWVDADKPWQFLAWCLDYVCVIQDPEHLSGLPIHQDATQSGIQIYSLLLRDTGGAAATNCVPADAPQDLYGLVAQRLLANLEEEKSPIAQSWLEFGIDRSCCKRPVMTRVYNATKHSATSYVREWVEERAREANLPIPTLEDSESKAVWFLTEKLWDAMAGVIESTEVAQKWLSDVAAVFVKHGRAISWTTPMGLPVHQLYQSSRRAIVKTLVGDTYRQLLLKQPVPGKLNGRRMCNAFAPNVIHSLDATAMMKTVVRLNEAGASSITCNHDSFATVAADSQLLAESTRRAYVELFSRDLLAELREELQKQIPEEPLPDLPRYGSLDVSVLEQSLYFFS